MEANYDDWKWWQQAHGVEFDDGWTVEKEEPMLDMGLTPDQALFQWEVLKDLSKLPLVNEL